jgi:SagB-type dehydrogenase family enzyme
MTASEVLTTSPVLFAHRGRDGRLVAGDARVRARFRLSGLRAAELAAAFVEPQTVAWATEGGFTVEELEAARDAGILVSEAESRRLGLWERHGWSRPAHLLFSQMDIAYEDEPDAHDQDALRERRRALVEDYERADAHPESRWLAQGDVLNLPAPPPTELALSVLTSRRSVRGFSPTAPSAKELAGVLHGGTNGLRTAAEDRAGGDPFRRLNSFYSWAHLFVAVQDVEGIPGGAYEYDWRGHRLLRSAESVDEADVLASIQGQRGVLGTGFVIYLVADLRRYAWLYRHSRAYLHVLIQVGELGQELLMAATALGLGGWPSPAVHESRSAALLGLPADDAIEVLSMIKLGRPVRR